MKRFFCLLLTPLLLLSSACAEALPSATLTASAVVQRSESAAILSFILSTEAKTVTEAQAAMDEQMAALRQTLTEQGIAQEDLRSLNYDVIPVNEYHYTKMTETTLLTAYRVTHELELHIQSERSAALLIDAVHLAGFDCSYDLSYAAETDPAVKDEALSAAVTEAMRQARVMAQAAGVTLETLVSIEEEQAGDEDIVRVTYALQGLRP